MKKLLLVLLAIVAFSCSDNQDPIQACNVDNVLEMPWLEDEIAKEESSEFGREYVSISMGRYHSQTVFMLGNCCPTCNSVIPVLDCSGNPLGVIGQHGISYDEITDLRVIWKSSDNACGI